MEFQQTYKTRAAAYRLFIAAQNLPRSQSQFYQDADRLGLVRPDKTVHLSDLLAYVQSELKIDPGTGQSFGERDHAEQMARLDREERELKIARLRREEERAKGKTIDTDLAEAVTRRKILTIYNKIRDQFRRDQEQMLFNLGLPSGKASLLMVEIIGSVDRAFNEMRDRKTFTAMILGGEDADE